MKTQRYAVGSGCLVLVNVNYPCGENSSAGSLVPVNEEYQNVLLDSRAAALLNKLMSEIHGWTGIKAVSGWRSMEQQREIWNSSMKKHGETFTKKYVAVPGHSEHQTGLAVDLGIKKDPVDFIRPDFPYTGLCQSFRQKAAGYGFVQRYPAKKEHVTGIAQEPWHFRYVGIPHAEIMTGMGFTLEEYSDFLKQFPYGKRPFVYRKENHEFEISFLPAGNMADFLSGEGEGAFSMVSGNNVDGYVVTKWKNGENEYGFPGKGY